MRGFCENCIEPTTPAQLIPARLRPRQEVSWRMPNENLRSLGARRANAGLDAGARPGGNTQSTQGEGRALCKMLEKLTIKHLGTERNGLKPPSQRCRPLMMLVLLTSASPLRPSAIGGKIAVIVGRCVAAPVGDYGGGGLLGAIVQGFSPGGLLAEINQLVRRG